VVFTQEHELFMTEYFFGSGNVENGEWVYPSVGKTSLRHGYWYD
jgi:hypothetical protein